MSCTNCPDLTCTCTMPLCVDTLRVGTVDVINTNVAVIFEKQSNGAIVVERVTSSATGIVDVTTANIGKDFFTDDSEYYISVTHQADYVCEDDYLNVTTFGGAIGKVLSVAFKRSTGDALSTLAKIKGLP